MSRIYRPGRMGAVGLLVIMASFLNGCHSDREPSISLQSKTIVEPSQHDDHDAAIPLSVMIYLKPLDGEVPGSKNDTPEMIALGKRLFFERGISCSKTQSCNDCHRLDNGLAGVDGLSTPTGAQGHLGKRNTPTVLNAALHFAQFWDGRAADLVEQAKGPVLNPIEMGMKNAEEVETRLAEIDGYQDAFAKAFPGQPSPITFDNAAKAIAAFERTLITPSRFDRYLNGDKDALTYDERIAAEQFSDFGCVECHGGAPVGGRLFKKFGVYHPYQYQEDVGRYEVTKLEEDRYVFKVPSLRNVTLTAPYFNDGKISTLEEAVRTMARVQLDLQLEPSEIAQIIRFLHTLEAEHPVHIEVDQTK